MACWLRCRRPRPFLRGSFSALELQDDRSTSPPGCHGVEHQLGAESTGSLIERGSTTAQRALRAGSFSWKRISRRWGASEVSRKQLDQAVVLGVGMGGTLPDGELRRTSKRGRDRSIRRGQGPVFRRTMDAALLVLGACLQPATAGQGLPRGFVASGQDVGAVFAPGRFQPPGPGSWRRRMPWMRGAVASVSVNPPVRRSRNSASRSLRASHRGAPRASHRGSPRAYPRR